MNRLIAFAALTGFALSLIVHLSALMGVDVSMRFPLVWVLHIGIFIVFIPFIISAGKTLGTDFTLTKIGSELPTWVGILGAVIFFYAAINFILFMAATEGGNPAIRKGVYVLESHGRILRKLTEQEYNMFNANVVRGFSGHWLVFYFVPFAYFMFRKKN